ncbi:hypothetical protein KPB2_5337 [Klebsiella pneumoniae Kb677]|nr:hypothetical protein KPB2_5337 [Klebsiella pneumoniae Kb677]
MTTLLLGRLLGWSIVLVEQSGLKSAKTTLDKDTKTMLVDGLTTEVVILTARVSIVLGLVAIRQSLFEMWTTLDVYALLETLELAGSFPETKIGGASLTVVTSIEQTGKCPAAIGQALSQ